MYHADYVLRLISQSYFISVSHGLAMHFIEIALGHKMKHNQTSTENDLFHSHVLLTPEDPLRKIIK